MLASARQSLRLLTILRTLARYDALQPLEGMLPPRLVRLLTQAFGTGRAPYAPGARLGERLAAALHALGPSFIKLGQALSVRPDLVGDALAGDLGRLRDRLPPFSAAEARAAITAELGKPVAELFEHFEDRPVAAASIAQVHFARLPDGSEVAVKVLRPGIEAAFRRDIAQLRWLARLAERLRPALRRLRPVRVVDTIAASVELEMDLRLEAAAASELAENMAAVAGFRVPKVEWSRTARRVLTSARVHGVAIDDRAGLLDAGHDLKRLAEQVIRVFLIQALQHGFFHADMHHGNLFVAADGTLAAVDFGIMGRIDRPTRLFMAEMLHAFLVGDWRRAAEVHFAAGYVPATQSVDAFAQACRAIGEPILGRPVTEISVGRLLAQLFQVTETFAMQTQPQLLLLQKTMVTVEGVARTLDPEINFWDAARPLIVEWMRDNMGPEARMRDAAVDAGRILRRLPTLADSLERAADLLAADGLRFDPASARLLAAEQARRRRGLTAAVWFAAGLLLLLLLRHF
ncbi:MAG TPA: 2-polyprenylphenol 6-hydroxylase [Candidatus Sulfotelmatobacter sp.]|nr:2-polyprenylphenol 6-hydroxylase [Candidatus Sulfotelmatobacter sp.]